jgi:signal transduction histidine kinase
MQAELERTRDALAQISQEKTELLHMVAHDLRTPLAALVLGTEYLLTSKQAATPEARETLGDMKSSMHQLEVLIDVLVDKQALETGQRAWTYLEIDAARETAAAVIEAARAGQPKHIEVRLSAQADLAPFQTDRRAFRQVVENLVSNAVKYSPRGARVEIEVAQAGACLRLTVSDRGPGVKPEHRQAIFSKYGKGSARPTGGERSTGLGLWIVARIVEHLEGRVWCEGQEGGGSRFVVELPRARSAVLVARPV